MPEFARIAPRSSTVFTGAHSLWRKRREDTGPPARLASMLKIAITLVFLFALAAALLDLSRGRRPTLLA
jgi:hypothetical protein